MFNPGIFAPVSKLSKPGSVPKPAQTPTKPQLVNQGSVDVSHVTPKVDTGNFLISIL